MRLSTGALEGTVLQQPWSPVPAVAATDPATTASTAVIDWSRRRTPIVERFPETRVHAPWVADFLGLDPTPPQRDLGALTRLRITDPNRRESNESQRQQER
jgi:hypothetical protein